MELMDKFRKLILGSLIEGQFDDFMNLILTPKEIENIDERISILRLLLEGKTQRDIAAQLGISITTVTRGNKFLEQHKDLCVKIFSNL